MNNKKKAWITWVGCTISGALCGLVYTAITLFYDTILKQTGCSPTQFGLIFTLISLGMIIGGMFVGKLIGINSKLFSSIGACGTAVLYIAIALSSNIYVIFASAFIFGLLFSFIGSTLTSIMLSQWFNRGCGKVVSYANTFANATPIVMIPVFASMVTAWGAQRSAFIIGIATTVICLICALFLIARFPGYYNIEPVDFGKEKENAQRVSETETFECSMPLGKMAVTPAFLLLFFGVFFMSAGNGIYSTNTTMLYQSFGLTYENAALAISLNGIAALVLVFLMGIVMDKVGARISCIIFAGMSAVGCLLVPFISGWSGAILLAITICGCRIWMFIGPVVIPQIFGVKKSPPLVGWIISSSSVASMIFGPIATTIYGNTGSFAIPMFIAGILMIVSIVCLSLGCSPKVKEAVIKADAQYLQSCKKNSQEKRENEYSEILQR